MENTGGDQETAETVGFSYLSGNLDIYNLFDIPVIGKESQGEIQEIVDENEHPRADILEKNEIYTMDEKMFEAIKQFFDKAGVNVSGTPWTTEDQDDFPGDLSIPLASLNRALAEGKLTLEVSKEDGKIWFSFASLDDFIAAHLKP